MTAAAETLDARPGWAKLREAADELHAAELLVGDPLATPATAIPHLRNFWRTIAIAGSTAGIGVVESDPGPDPGAWLEGQSATYLRHWRSLAAEHPLSKRELRAHVEAARSLLARLEPEIGGVPLHRRKQRIAWASLGAFMVVAPVALYVALNAEVPGTGPWHAAYFANDKLEDDPVLVREDSIEHDWDDKAPHEQIAPDKFSVRWDTCLVLDTGGLVAFQVNANDGARVFIDGEVLLDAWDRDPKTRRRGFGSGELELEAGVHHLRVEYFESLGDASIKLSASLDGELPVPLDRDQLRYPGDDFDEQDPCAAVP